MSILRFLPKKAPRGFAALFAGVGGYAAQFRESKAMPITGKFTFRRSFWGRIVLQVEEEVKSAWPMSRKSATRRRFRDANLMDLAAPELRTLIDLRQKPRVDLNQYYYTPMPSPHRAEDDFDGVQPSTGVKSPIAQGLPRTTNH